jgi:hypothetical protein
MSRPGRKGAAILTVAALATAVAARPAAATTSDQVWRVVPLASAEVFYDSRPGAWARLRVEAGADIEELLGRGTVLELYYVRQYDRSEPTLVNGIGITFDIYR